MQRFKNPVFRFEGHITLHYISICILHYINHCCSCYIIVYYIILYHAKAILLLILLIQPYYYSYTCLYYSIITIIIVTHIQTSIQKITHTITQMQNIITASYCRSVIYIYIHTTIVLFCLLNIISYYSTSCHTTLRK